MVKAIFVGLTTLVWALTLVPNAVAADAGYGRQKVVYHINSDEDRTLNAALVNIQNHITAVGRDKIELVVVMHGDGVGLLQKANTNLNLQARVVGLKKQGVTLLLCENSLKNKQLDFRRDLFQVSRKDLVPNGVAELVRLQQQGYLYVKP